MNSIDTLTSADGQFRVRIVPDDSAENPRDWAEPLTGALTVPDRRYSTAPVSGPLADQWHRLTNEYAQHTYSDAVTIMARYIRAFHGGVSAVLSPYGVPTMLFYVTPAMMRDAGFSAEEITSARMSELLEGEREEYRAWVEGEVYGVIVEERIEWMPTDTQQADRLGPMETWETIDSLWSIIGDDYAEESARRMLADTLDVTIRPADDTFPMSVTTSIHCSGCGQPITVSDRTTTECGGHGEGACDAEGDSIRSDHQRAVEIAAPFLD